MDSNVFKEQVQFFDSYMSIYYPEAMKGEQYIKDFCLDKKSPFIYSLLGENLYKEIENITITASEAAIQQQITRLMTNNSTFINKLRQANPFFTWARILKILKNNAFDENYNNEIKKGMKPMRAFKKLADMYSIPEFEKFRKEHAQTISQQTIKGTLCLSALPADYLTLSDNDENWHTCYSWKHTSTYRASTLSLMSAPNTIIAYIKSDKTYKGWNSKQWRQLIYVDENLILPSTQYPYNHDLLENKVIDFLKSLYPEYNNFTSSIVEWYGDKSGCFYDNDNNLTIEFDTTINSYCDFPSPVVIYTAPDANSICITYDDAAYCLSCGKPIYYNESDGAAAVERYSCDDCNPYICPACGNPLDLNDEENYIYSGYYEDYVHCLTCYNETLENRWLSISD